MTINKEELKKEFEWRFEEFKKESGLKLTLNELEEEFNLYDSVFEQGFVRENFFPQLGSKIVDYFRIWNNYLNSLIFPSPNNYLNQVEFKIFNSEKDKKEIWEVIKICMNVSTKYSLVLLEKDIDSQSKFIEDSFYAWKNSVKPFLIKLIKKTNSSWNSDK